MQRGTVIPDSKELVWGGEYDDEPDADGKVVHGFENACGDSATVCGMFLVDGLAAKESRKPIDCDVCISALESRGNFIKRKGKWY